MRKQSCVLLGMVAMLLCLGSNLLMAYSSQEVIKPVLNGFVAQTLDQSEYGVVGLEMLIRSQSYPIVQHVFPGSPAEQVGFRPGDVIVSVNGTTTWGKSLQEIDDLIPNVPGVQVNFAYSRQQQVQKTTLRVAALHEVSPTLRSFYQPAITNR